MAEAGGAENLAMHYKKASFMGFTEVLLHLRTIFRQMDECKADIAAFRPDVLILIDYAGFNLRIARFAKENGIPTYYYIAPKLWAWKESRVKKIRKYVDRLFVIFPFEIDYFRSKGIAPVYEGNPLIDSIDQRRMGLLYMLWRIYMHTKRLRNELLQEKDSLTASEKQLRVVTKEAEAANKKKSAFIANISHEVRTPLNAIVGFSELLASSEYSEEEKIRFAGEVNHSSELLLNLVNDVLDLSRLESGKIKFSVKPNDLVACCQRALDSIRHRVKPGVRLTFTPSIESYTLNTDALRLQQLLTNLLSNAAKFTSEGEINLSFTVDEGKEEVRFSVTDTGCGIPEDKCEKIFERFEKLDDFIQGTGLGLSVCQIISEQLNGSLSVDISYKDGARFVFIHPTNLIETPI